MRAIEISTHGGPEVLTNEVCGTVAAVGMGMATLAVGDRVATSDALAAYVEFCLAQLI